jgi:histidinol-phosphate aminotransferase
LRQTHGIKLRDATSFGLPGWLRLGVLGPDAQDALATALTDGKTRQTTLETTT